MKNRNLLYIGNKLASHGVTMTSIESLGQLLESEGYHLWYASSKKNKALRLIDMILKTIRYAKKADYVLIDTYSTSNFWFAFIISQLCRILDAKYIANLHGGNLPNRLKNNPVLCRMIFKNAYKNVAPSNYLLQAFENRGFAELLFIPNTLEIQNYTFKQRKKLRPKLLWVRSLASIYNPEMALQVLGQLQNDFADASLCMVGPDKENKLQDLEQIADVNHLNVNFTGKLSKPDWTKLSAEYDIFINTTHFDNTPVSVMEAMALGLPVVSTNVGGIPYLLENSKTAMLVNDNDASAMVSAIKELIFNDSLSNQIIGNALDLVEKFDWSIVKTKWNEILI
ncbi:hypothetical protein FNO01nite_10900 [Flavobacterium noncentrifugens]|uniref:Glycosyltransferase involved in cell wall bisynthesis n=1 Tax=Flavobacterium noncentrifugens TaxID=1128970 RepID=A0A1G8VCR9_9FLAO|nr:glycosyltransferase family 4 protein [Flavobacterium noncentrifugens]GEP50418.1 hypothetical protein FNO01nite_10900 [Flavobacterium noncentrifugens]SDJ63145.1 Glycosyltransferase involved in cell wall bisynthesis [Flavobacterium noncentrifugens]